MILKSSFLFNKGCSKLLKHLSRYNCARSNIKKTVNVTLGLPITRVSVDHGTALDLVGTGNIDISSFVEAIKVAKRIYNGYT